MARSTDPDVDDFERYMLLPETNKAVMEVLCDDFMAPADYIATLKAQVAVWREP